MNRRHDGIPGPFFDFFSDGTLFLLNGLSRTLSANVIGDGMVLCTGRQTPTEASLLQSAKLYGREPWAYLKDVLTRLPTRLNSRIEELLPHKWQPVG